MLFANEGNNRAQLGVAVKTAVMSCVEKMSAGSRLLPFFAVMLVSVVAHAEEASPKLFGNVGYFYGLNEADGGSRNEDSTVIGSLGARTYLWQPWFAQLNGGATFSRNTSENENVTNQAEVTSGNASLSLFPVSRFPFYASFNQVERDYDWANKHTREDHFFTKTRSRSMTARQSVVTNWGSRLDAWYDISMRDFDDYDAQRPEYDIEDKTLGGKFQHRGQNYNLFLNASKQEQDNSDVDRVSTSQMVSMTHNYFPTSTFYIKTLGSQSVYDIKDESAYSDYSFKSESETTNDQASSMFYWRPEYKPYTVTGAVRLNRRTVEFPTTDSRQHIFAANIAGNYHINRKTRLTLTGNVSDLETQGSNSLAGNVAAMMYYQSDRFLLGKMTYYWFADAGVQGDVVAEYQKTDTGQTGNASLGHAANRSWNTGNRSNVRVSGQQAVKQTTKLGRAEDDTSLLVHTASAAYNLSERSGSFYAQLTGIDSREVKDAGDNQVVNLQVSKSSTISRLSSWGGNLSSQMTRRDAGDGSNISLTTTSSAQINYQHSRLFGIYKLKFRTELEGTSIDNRSGADRLQGDWEGRFSYSVGKLNTALFLRAMESDSGVGNRMGVLQINRSF